MNNIHSLKKPTGVRRHAEILIGKLNMGGVTISNYSMTIGFSTKPECCGHFELKNWPEECKEDDERHFEAVDDFCRSMYGAMKKANIKEFIIHNGLYLSDGFHRKCEKLSEEVHQRYISNLQSLLES